MIFFPSKLHKLSRLNCQVALSLHSYKTINEGCLFRSPLKAQATFLVEPGTALAFSLTYVANLLNSADMS